jgi:uncharacterized protein (TIGR02594 family)
MNVTAFDIAQRFVGVKEVAGPTANPTVLAMLQLDGAQVSDDAVPWCSAFANYVAWLLRLPRSKSLRARSWLLVGTPVERQNAVAGFDVVILNRGGPQDPTVVDAQGHVGFFAGWAPDNVLILGGNQGDSVSVRAFPTAQILGIRRLA